MTTSSALWQARARLGAQPVRELYARVAGPLTGAGAPGAWLGDLRVMAIDGFQLDVPDTADNEDEFGRDVSLGLDAPYPKVKVLGLGECGTHAVIDAHLGGVFVDERELAPPLLASIEPGMLVLADRGFQSRAFWDEAAATGAQLLWRVQSSLKLHVVSELSDGSYLSVLLIDIERQRIAEIEARQRGGYRVLRSHRPEVVCQEIWALLQTHYSIRALMYEAADPERLDPLRLSFIRTLRIVRRHVTGQAGFSP